MYDILHHYIQYPTFLTLVIETFEVPFPKEGNSIITSDTLHCRGVYRNAINTFAEMHHAATLEIILYHFSCTRLWH